MIKRSCQFNLGQDTTRIKDKRDAERQHSTVDTILSRFFSQNSKEQWEVQILADEVGMGKTFVGLAVAYSMLQAMMKGAEEADLEGCYQKVLVITPQNSALFTKWTREVSEFVKRCVLPEHKEEAKRWFSATPVTRIDELVAELRRPGMGPRMIVANMSIFSGGKLLDYDLKRRFLLAVLFRMWGNKLSVDRRKRLLKGAPDWPRNPYYLNDFSEREQDKLLFDEEEVLSVLNIIEKEEWRENPEKGGLIQELLDLCRELSERYVWRRDEEFYKVEEKLNALYKKISSKLIRKNLPLVIVDEAHNWKNHKSGYTQFTEIIAPNTRRLLMLTATPFQLHPEEMLSVLEVSDHIKPCSREDSSQERVERLKKHREEVIRPVLKKAATSSRKFTEAWMRLPRNVDAEQIAELWESSSFETAKARLEELADLPGVVKENELQKVVEQTLVGVDPQVRQLLREALRLYCFNTDLSCEMGRLVIRHRRSTGHRLFKVGREFLDQPERISTRPDSHLLHTSYGIDVRGDGELPHYLLMRCVSEMKKWKGRSSLGNALTGCYSTLLESKEGRDIKNFLKNEPVSKVYFDLLLKMVNEKHDPIHPKVQNVVHSVISAWEKGEKSLVFCFRTNTAKRLQEIIKDEIGKKLDGRRKECLGGEEQLKFLRSRITGRDRDLITIGLDRVLWSYLWAKNRFEDETSLKPEDLYLKENDLEELARLALSFGLDISGRRVDRVFLNRAIEHIIARRIKKEKDVERELTKLLTEMASPDWITHPYGLTPKEEGDDEGEDKADFDERGVHVTYEAIHEPNESEVKDLARQISERRERAKKQKQVSIFDFYSNGPSLWLGENPVSIFSQYKEDKKNILHETLADIHVHLHELTFSETGIDWESRRKMFQAMRKAMLRESVLLRLLPSSAERDQAGWGDLLVKAFYSPLPGQHESFADRIKVFLEDILASSGSLDDKSSARYFLYDATRLRDQNFVALVWGETKNRERIFAGFNTPLLPEVLICTTVGQEGIDLHRHCRHVIHYDLAWNPAVLEQRTGRADRIGSKTFRERDLTKGDFQPFLEIGVPFLAGTYDERMYEELRIRAQTFEVLTGGELVADYVEGGGNPEGKDDIECAEGEEKQIDFVSLPEKMVNDLRVKLHVWSD